MRRGRCLRTAFVGLLVVAAISVAAGSGRKPPKEQRQSVSLRPLSAGEIGDILRRFPEMVSGRIASDMKDTGHVKRLFPFSELTSSALSRAFPRAKFYEGRDFGRLPSYPYMMAIAGGKRYVMPNGLNRLLADNGLKVTDENVIELAEAFVVVALGEWADGGLSYPQIDFLETKKFKLKPDVQTIDAAVLTVRVGEHIEKWHFNVLRNQFVAAGSKNEEGRRKDYRPVMIDSLPGRGQLAPTPDRVGEASQEGDARAERDSLGTGLASGRKPAQEERANTSVRVLSEVETSQLASRFPGLRARVRVTAELLERLFPKTAFYGALYPGRPPYPYLISISDDSEHMMPAGYNRLLRQYGTKVASKNIVDLAKAFVILAVLNEPITDSEGDAAPNDSPQIDFLQGQRTDDRDTGNPDAIDARIVCRIDGEVQAWEFSQSRHTPRKGVWVKVGQFGVVYQVINGKRVREYTPLDAAKTTGRH